MAKSAYETAQGLYQEMSEAFTEVNKEYNRAVREDALTDELELRFLRAEKALHEAYRDQQNAKMEESA